MSSMEYLCPEITYYNYQSRVTKKCCKRKEVNKRYNYNDLQGFLQTLPTSEGQQWHVHEQATSYGCLQKRQAFVLVLTVIFPPASVIRNKIQQ